VLVASEGDQVVDENNIGVAETPWRHQEWPAAKMVALGKSASNKPRVAHR
jgi:hypothetical protein